MGDLVDDRHRGHLRGRAGGVHVDDGDGLGLGGREERGDAGGVEEASKAIELYEKACGLGEVDGCNGAGELLAAPDSPPDAKSRALTAFIKACVGHSGYGCLRAGVAFHDGVGIPADLEKARSHFTRACDFSEQDGCRAAEQLTASSPRS